MAEKEVQSSRAPAVNALASLALPKMDLVGPTVDDDIRRAIWRYGAEAVKDAVKEATKAKRGRKREPDWMELREVIEADARAWLLGSDPFSERSNYAIAKTFAEQNPGHSAISTHKRIERKLSKKPFDRRWFTLVAAENMSRDGHPYNAYLRTLEALAELQGQPNPDLWPQVFARARATVADYEARYGEAPSADMSFNEVERAAKESMAKVMLGESPPNSLLGGILKTSVMGSST